MPSRRDDPEDDPEDDDDWDDDDLPDGVYHDEDEPTVPCPHCRAEVLEDAQYCGKCENYISKEDAPREPRSRFWVVMMLFALLAALAWVAGGG